MRSYQIIHVSYRSLLLDLKTFRPKWSPRKNSTRILIPFPSIFFRYINLLRFLKSTGFTRNTDWKRQVLITLILLIGVFLSVHNKGRKNTKFKKDIMSILNDKRKDISKPELNAMKTLSAVFISHGDIIYRCSWDS